MANVKEYGYYVKGDKVALVEKDTAFDNDPNSRDYGPGANRTQWKSPQSSVSQGIEFEYSYVLNIDGIQDENFEIDIPQYLQKAIVYYMKARSFEDILDLEKSVYFMAKFRKQVEKFNDRLVAGIRIVSSGPFGIR